MNAQIKKIGIVGGNITAAFICQEASKRGIESHVLAPSIHTTASPFATGEIIGEITLENINRLALRVDALVFCTTELPAPIEKIQTKVPMYPSKEGLKLIADRIFQLTKASEKEVPVPKFNHYQKGEDHLEILNNIEIPFTFYEKGDTYCKVTDVMSEKEAAHFANELQPDAKEWLSEQLSQYEKILSITILKDQKGKMAVYEVLEELNTDKGIEINLPATVTKTMQQKVTRFAKKLLKDMDTQGIFSFEFGVKEDKSIELIDITPGIGIGDIATYHYADYATYEQLMNLIMGLPLQNPVVDEPATIYFVKERDKEIAFPYHFYEMDRHLQEPIFIYIQRR